MCLLVLGVAAVVPRPAVRAAPRAKVMQQQIERGKQMCAEAERLLKEGKTEKALVRYREVLAFLPESSRAKEGVMARTERLAVTEDRNGMVQTTLSEGELQAEDVLAYAQLQRVADRIGHGETVEYWKSAPYLLNFMDDYHLKRCLAESSDDPALAALLGESEALLLDPVAVERYRRVDPRNARLRALMADTLGRGAAKLLWIPPALPYYQPAGVFAEPGVQGFTKRLVFSSWQVVPKVIACLLSYEAERVLFPSGTRNTAEARKRRARLLDFRLDRGRPATMPLLGLVFPCITLACECDPLVEAVRSAPERPTRSEALACAEKRIGPLLRGLPEFKQAEGREDEAWYWAAPILLDRKYHPEASRAWWNGVAQRWGLPGTEGEEPTAWREHIARALDLGEGEVLGRPPKDLGHVLAQMALGAPGIVALRSLRARLWGDTRHDAGRRGARGGRNPGERVPHPVQPS